MKQNCIAILGKEDKPTDAVEEYCRYLGEALLEHGYDLKIERIAWGERGWAAALQTLRHRAKNWRGTWVLVQYTALAWSARGFPLRFLRVLKTLKAAGARVSVVYHDVEPYGGTRMIDRLRRRTQLHTMRVALQLSEAAIFTVPTEKLSWAQSQRGKAYFIPVGANLPTSGGTSPPRKEMSINEKLTIAVFGVTGGEPGKKEIENIVEAVRSAASRLGTLRLVVLGRNTQSAEAELRNRFGDSAVELRVLGVLPGKDVVRSLSVSDVLLFVRGPISTR